MCKASLAPAVHDPLSGVCSGWGIASFNLENLVVLSSVCSFRVSGRNCGFLSCQFSSSKVGGQRPAHSAGGRLVIYLLSN